MLRHTAFGRYIPKVDNGKREPLAHVVGRACSGIGELGEVGELSEVGDHQSYRRHVEPPSHPKASLVEASALEARLRSLDGVWVTIGSCSEGLEGFRMSLQEARRARTLITRVDEPPTVTAFDDVAIPALMSSDADDVR